MKIIVDNKIPYLEDAVRSITSDVLFMEGREFTPEVVRDADALILRTRTRCNRQLLEGSNVKFIVTATIGFDHIDADYCREAGIEWANAPGCNAGSVAQYIESSLRLIERHAARPLSEMTLGIVGVGHVGSRVAEMARSLGMRVLLNDPPRAELEGEAGFSPMAQLEEECDIITFHTPLIREGRHSTYHLGDADFFRSLKRCPYIINSSRGEVVSNDALLQALRSGTIRQAVVDVWENEPNINLELLNEVLIGTPHIAGYSADGKVNATVMSLNSLCRFFGIEKEFHIEPPAPAQRTIHARTLADATLAIYNPEDDCSKLRQHPDHFEQIRNNYPLRREKEAYEFIIEG
jgi:erythronate-4-phosphate dehydrogenase